MAANKYDVFISYRRPDGASMARQIDVALAKHGLNPFLHLSDISRGHFEFALLKRVAETPNLLLVLTPGALERCRENGDGLGQEIAQAIASSRNIIPVVLPGFEFPNDLPRPLHDLLERHRVECSETLSPPAVATILQRVSFGISRKRWLARRCDRRRTGRGLDTGWGTDRDNASPRRGRVRLEVFRPGRQRRRDRRPGAFKPSGSDSGRGAWDGRPIAVAGPADHLQLSARLRRSTGRVPTALSRPGPRRTDGRRSELRTEPVLRRSARARGQGL